MKQFFSLFILLSLSLNLYAVTAVENSKNPNSMQVIISGSGCPQKQSKPVELKVESDKAEIPMDFDTDLSGPNLARKNCQARIAIKGVAGFQYELREVSQSLLFTAQKGSQMSAELSYGMIGQNEFKIDQEVKDAGEYRHVFVKKLIKYASPCGKDTILRIQTSVRSSGGKNKFKADPVKITVEKRQCSDPIK